MFSRFATPLLILALFLGFIHFADSTLDSNAEQLGNLSNQTNIREFLQGLGTFYETENTHNHDQDKVKLEWVPRPTSKSISSARTPKITPPPNPTTALSGFSSTLGIKPGETGVNVRKAFRIYFNKPISESLIKSFAFYPKADFDYEIIKSEPTGEVRITPKRLQRYTTYVFGLKNSKLCTQSNPNYCSPKNQSWAYRLSYRTSFAESFSYGKSVDQRDLKVFMFGKNDTKGKKIMLTGGIHGEEWRSGGLSRLVNYLYKYPQKIIGKNKTIIIIPFTNPDGSTVERRFNSRGVNLNRNWPAGWEFAPASMKGSAPLSEPETKSLAELKLLEKPTHLISYHAQWPPYGIIFLGDGDNPSTRFFARWVAARTGYPLGIYPDPDASGDVGGDQTVWSETQGIRSILIEATYRQNDDWSKNFPMYQALINDF